MPKRKLPTEALEYFREQGARGGKKGGSLGGKTAALNMTPAQRKARAKKAVAAREAKRATTGTRAKRQDQPLKVHGDPLDTPKKAPAKKKEK